MPISATRDGDDRQQALVVVGGGVADLGLAELDDGLAASC